MKRYGYCVFLISGCILSHQILLMQLFSIIQWHNFAYMFISIALLGFGFSGTLLTLFRNYFYHSFPILFPILLLLYSLSILPTFILAQSIQFNPFTLLWDYRQILHLGAYYLIFSLPFTLGALIIGSAIFYYSEHIQKVYMYSMLGSGFGAMLIIPALYLIPVEELLYLITLLSLVGFILIPFHRIKYIIVITIILLLGTGWYFHISKLQISEYKSIQYALQWHDATIVQEKSNPFGKMEILKSELFRYAPGLSLNYTGSVPRQKAIYINSELIGALNITKDLFKSDFYNYLPLSIPYSLKENPEILIIGPGSGIELETALFHYPSNITGIDINPDIIRLLNAHWSDSEFMYRLNFQTGDGRHYLLGTNKKYDIIQLPLLGAIGPASGGVYALGENYLFTVEAIRQYYQSLNPNGIIIFQSWTKIPPRDILRLFSTVLEMMEMDNIDSPESRIVLLRNLQTNVLLVKKGFWSAAEIDFIIQQAGERSYDLVYFPGITQSDALQFTILPEPTEFELIQTLLFGDRNAFYRDYIFNIAPSCDNQPYFANFFKWSALPFLIETMGRDWIPFIEWGYLVIIATFLQAVLLSFLLIILPLLFLREIRTGRIIQPSIYFSALGLGYMFLEIGLIKKLSLYFSSPILSVAVILSLFLISSGLGSFYSRNLFHRWKWNNKPLVPWFIIGWMILFFLIGDWLLSFAAIHSLWLVLLFSIILISPLAFFMGMLFPIGINILRTKQPQIIPWAWGINGYTSVLGAILATIFSMEWGINSSLIAGMICYLISYLAIRILVK